MSKSKCLNEGTNLEDSSTNHEGLPSSNSFSKGKDEESAEEAAALETRDNIGRVEIDCSGILASKTEIISERSQSKRSTNET